MLSSSSFELPQTDLPVWELLSHSHAPFLPPLSCPQLPAHLQKCREQVCNACFVLMNSNKQRSSHFFSPSTTGNSGVSSVSGIAWGPKRMTAKRVSLCLLSAGIHLPLYSNKTTLFLCVPPVAELSHPSEQLFFSLSQKLLK